MNVMTQLIRACALFLTLFCSLLGARTITSTDALVVKWYPQPGLTQVPTLEDAMLEPRDRIDLVANPKLSRHVPHKALPQNHVAEVDSCHSFLVQRQRGYFPASVRDERLSNSYEEGCSTLSFLSKAHTANINHFNSIDVRSIWQSLPVSAVFPTHHEANKQRGVLTSLPDTQALDPTYYQYTKDEPLKTTITLHSKQGQCTTHLRLLAQGAVRPGGQQALLMSLEHWMDSSEYLGHQVVVLEKTGPNAPITVKHFVATPLKTLSPDAKTQSIVPPQPAPTADQHSNKAPA